MRYDPSLTSDQRWTNDELQFTRLLGEMAQNIRLTAKQLGTLSDVMDMPSDVIQELLDRASDAWDLYKASIPVNTPERDRA